MDYTKKFGEQEFRFTRPNIPQIDRYLRLAAKGPTRASQSLAAETVLAEDKEAWLAHVQVRPGSAVQVASMMLEDLGYGDDLGD